MLVKICQAVYLTVWKLRFSKKVKYVYVCVHVRVYVCVCVCVCV